MANRVLDPTSNTDAEAYSEVGDLLENPTLTPEQIAANFWYKSEQRKLLAAIPDANIDLPGGDTGRSYPQREDVVDYFVLRIVYKNLTGGGSTATGRTTREGSGALKSRTESLGQRSLTLQYDTGTSSSVSNVISIDSRIQQILEDANELAAILGIAQEEPVSEFSPTFDVIR